MFGRHVPFWRMSGQLRMAQHQLQQDLDGLTLHVKPYVEPEAASGYFEYIEGWATDRDVDGDGTGGTVPSTDIDGDQLGGVGDTDADFHPVDGQIPATCTDCEGRSGTMS